MRYYCMANALVLETFFNIETFHKLEAYPVNDISGNSFPRVISRESIGFAVTGCHEGVAIYVKRKRKALKNIIGYSESFLSRCNEKSI